ncbi:MAG: type II CAAX endopeptidase family protein [Acidobacteriota bacterium]
MTLPNDGSTPPLGTPESEVPTTREPSPDDRTWGALASLLLSGAVFLFYSLVQGFGIVAVLVVQPYGELNAFEPERLINQYFGQILWVGTLIALPVALVALWLLTRLRRPGGVAQYLGLRGFRWWQGLLWLAATYALVTAITYVATVFERPPIPDFIEQAMTTAGFMPGLVLAVGLAAPIIEELLFRGFLYEGLAKSRLGEVGAIVLISALFAVIHLQYDAFDMFSVFLLGLLFGIVRWQTGSTWLAILLHAAINLFALFQSHRYLESIL